MICSHQLQYPNPCANYIDPKDNFRELMDPIKCCETRGVVYVKAVLMFSK